MSTNLVYRCLVGVALALLVAHAGAVNRTNMKKHERAALPKFCKSVNGMNELGQYTNMVRRYGDSWRHMHHYCWSLVSLMRYNSASSTAQQRNGMANAALADMNYVLERSEPGFVMWYTIMNKKARTLIMEQRLDEAKDVITELIFHFPKRADGYGLLAELQMAAGSMDTARKTLDEAHEKVENKNRLAAINRALKMDK